MTRLPSSTDPYWSTLPTPGLRRFVDELEPGRFTTTALRNLWAASRHNDEDHRNSSLIFRYALNKVGIILVTATSVVKFDQP